MKKIIFLIMAMSACLLVLSGCSVNKYNAELYDNLGQYINEDFYKENAFDVSAEAYFDKSYNKKKLFIVKTEDERRKIFYEDFNAEIDFDTQILIVYTCVTTNPLERKLDEIKLNGDKLEIILKDKIDYGDGNSSCSPYQRWIAVKMDKVEFDSIRLNNRDFIIKS